MTLEFSLSHIRLFMVNIYVTVMASWFTCHSQLKRMFHLGYWYFLWDGLAVRSLLIQIVPSGQTSQVDLAELEAYCIWAWIHMPFWMPSRFLLGNYCCPVCPSHLCADILGTGRVISLHWYICRCCSALEIRF